MIQERKSEKNPYLIEKERKALENQSKYAGTGFTPPIDFIGPVEVDFRQSTFFVQSRAKVALSPEGRKIKGPYSKRQRLIDELTERQLVLEEEAKIHILLEDDPK